ncbi:hypothetical protein Tco_1377342 [Tanacetum coccineum]
MIPQLWSPELVVYDKDATLGISHSGPHRQQFYRAMVNSSSKHIVFSKQRILSVLSVQVEKKFGYGYLNKIVIKRADQKQYTIKEGDFPDLHPNDIEDMLLLLNQNKLWNLNADAIIDLGVAL